MTPNNKKSPTHTGFAFGVALGAIIGAGAFLLMDDNELKKFRAKLKSTAADSYKKLENEYPEATHKIEDVLHQAMADFEVAGNKIQELSDSQDEDKKKTTPKRVFFHTTRTE
jgi:gas vesicle protein